MQIQAILHRSTTATNFPTTPGAYRTSYQGGTYDTFVTKVDANGSAWAYSTLLGGNGSDLGYGIAVDASGRAYVTGSTTSANFPLQNERQSTFGGGIDAFVSQLAANGGRLDYSTLLGGASNDIAYGIAVTSGGQASVTGYTASTTFPTTNTVQLGRGGGIDAFVTTYEAGGGRVLLSTYLGGNGDDRTFGIALDTVGNTYVTGWSKSTTFPAGSTMQGVTAGGTDAFVAKLSPVLATRTITYSYDGLQRLTGAVESPGTSYAYAYDLVGNRTQVKVNGNVTESRGYNAADQVVGWTYDAAGNLLSDGTLTTTYDALNRTLTTTGNGQSRSYAYNGDGVLVSQTANGTATRFTQDLASPLSQILQTQGSATTNYLYGHERLANVSGSQRTWYGTDALGSVRETRTDSGGLLGTFGYDPWSTPQGGVTPDAFGFTGEWQDSDVGLVNLRARWYQPRAGRFLTRDPFEGFAKLPYSLHPYQYGFSNPIRYIDPSGQCVLGLPCPLNDWSSDFFDNLNDGSDEFFDDLNGARDYMFGPPSDYSGGGDNAGGGGGGGGSGQGRGNPNDPCAIQPPGPQMPPLPTPPPSANGFVTVYRGTRIGAEINAFHDTGHLLSDAARRAYFETASLQEAYDEADRIHQQWIERLGSEAAYVELHAQGLEATQSYGLLRTMISVTTSKARAMDFADGGAVFEGHVARNMLIPQTLATSNEEEYLIRYGIGGFEQIR